MNAQDGRSKREGRLIPLAGKQDRRGHCLVQVEVVVQE